MIQECLKILAKTKRKVKKSVGVPRIKNVLYIGHTGGSMVGFRVFDTTSPQLSLSLAEFLALRIYKTRLRLDVIPL